MRFSVWMDHKTCLIYFQLQGYVIIVQALLHLCIILKMLYFHFLSKSRRWTAACLCFLYQMVLNFNWLAFFRVIWKGCVFVKHIICGHSFDHVVLLKRSRIFPVWPEKTCFMLNERDFLKAMINNPKPGG